MILKIQGQIRGGKNHMNIDPRSGQHYPNAAWAEWRDAAVMQVKLQMKEPTITKPSTMFVIYTPSDRRRRDAPAMLDAIFHVLERSQVVADDALFIQIHWYQTAPSKTTAGASISISDHVEVPAP